MSAVMIYMEGLGSKDGLLCCMDWIKQMEGVWLE